MQSTTAQKTKLSVLLSILLVASLLSIAVVVAGPPTLTNQALASGELADGSTDYYYYHYNSTYCPDLVCVFMPVVLKLLDVAK